MTKWIVASKGDGYKIRAKRVDTAAYSIIIAEWRHPNYGYWADAGLYINSLHHFDEWIKRSDAKWFEETSLTEFVEKYPQFKQLFKNNPRDRLASKFFDS
jgi:hypothetical protein